MESIVVTPANSTTTAGGQPVTFTATGKFEDDDDDDLTNLVTWAHTLIDGTSDTGDVKFGTNIKGEFFVGDYVATYRIYASIKNTEASTTNTITTVETITGATTLYIQ